MQQSPIALHRSWRRPVAVAAGGKKRLAASAAVEVVLSALIAPVQMLIQTQQILDILRGRNSGWESQVRKASSRPGGWSGGGTRCMWPRAWRCWR